MNPTDDWTKWEPHGHQRDPWEEFKHPDEQWKNWTGEKRWEIVRPIKTWISVFKRLFGKKEK